MDDRVTCLVVTRRKGQSVCIGDATVTVLGKNRLKISAPRSQRVLRSELDGQQKGCDDGRKQAQERPTSDGERQTSAARKGARRAMGEAPKGG